MRAERAGGYKSDLGSGSFALDDFANLAQVGFGGLAREVYRELSA
jgi:hypothetical protein